MQVPGFTGGENESIESELQSTPVFARAPCLPLAGLARAFDCPNSPTGRQDGACSPAEGDKIVLSLLRLPSRPRPHRNLRKGRDGLWQAQENVSNQVVAEGECKLMARNTELMTQPHPMIALFTQNSIKLRNMNYGTWRCTRNERSVAFSLLPDR